MVSGSCYLMDFPLSAPARYRASGNGNGENDPGTSFLSDTRITAMLY
jgi:hypothetical protein